MGLSPLAFNSPSEACFMRWVSSSRLIVLALAMGSCMGLSVPALATSVDFYIQNANLTSSALTQTGSLDVYVVTDPATFSSKSYDGDVIADSTAGLTLLSTSYGTSLAHTTAPYSVGLFVSNQYSAGEVFASDNTPLGSPAALQSGFGLFRVNYQIDPNTVGTYNLSFDPIYSDMSDSSGVALPGVTFHGGTITVAAAPETPEPASLAVLALGAVGLLARRRR